MDRGFDVCRDRITFVLKSAFRFHVLWAHLKPNPSSPVTGQFDNFQLGRREGFGSGLWSSCIYVPTYLEALM